MDQTSGHHHHGPADEAPLPHGRLWANRSQEQLDAVKAADIVIGRNIKTGAEVPYYGVALLGRAVRRNERVEASVYRVDVDPDTDDVEALCAMVEAMKGACCYDAFSEPAEFSGA